LRADGGMRKTIVGDEMLFSKDEMRSRCKEINSRDRTQRRSSSLGAKQNSSRRMNQQQQPPIPGHMSNSSPNTQREFMASSEKIEQTGAGLYKLKKLIGHKR